MTNGIEIIAPTPPRTGPMAPPGFYSWGAFPYSRRNIAFISGKGLCEQILSDSLKFKNQEKKQRMFMISSDFYLLLAGYPVFTIS